MYFNCIYKFCLQAPDCVCMNTTSPLELDPKDIPQLLYCAYQGFRAPTIQD